MNATRITLALLIVAASFITIGCAQRVGGSLNAVHFDTDSSTIKSEYHAVLKGNAAWLQAKPGSSAVVEGHCDERGSTEYNIALGDRRAKSAKSFLQHLGVSGSRVSTISYGEERPTCRSSNESCWWKNRRAEFRSR